MHDLRGHRKATGGLYLRGPEGLDRPYHGLRSDAGYHQACFGVDDPTRLTEVQIEWDRDEPDRWLNPLGLSGRTRSCSTEPV